MSITVKFAEMIVVKSGYMNAMIDASLEKKSTKKVKYGSIKPNQYRSNPCNHSVITVTHPSSMPCKLPINTNNNA